MIQAITPATNVMKSFQSVEIFQKLYQLAISIFRGSTSLYFMGYGMKEVVIDGCKQKIPTPSAIQFTDAKIQASIKWFYREIRREKLSEDEFGLIHGTAILGTGALGGLSTLHYLSAVELGAALPMVNGFCNGLFIFANFIALHRHAVLFHYSNATIKQHPEHAEALKRIRISSLFGMISNINYLIATFSIFVSGPVLIALIFGCIGALTNCFKILYDFFKLQ